MKKIVIYILLMNSIAFNVCAYEIPEDFLDNLPFETGSGDAEDIEDTYSGLIERVKTFSKSEIKSGLKKSVNIIVICGICAIAGIFKKTDEDAKGRRIVETAGVCLLLMTSLTDTKSLLIESRDAITEMGVFSKIMMPLLATWASCAGKPVSAVAITSGAMVYTSACCAVAENMMFVLIITFILLKTAGIAGDNIIAKGMADALKNGLMYIVKICLAGISFYITLSGCIMSAGDSTAVKTAKAAVNVLPGIGSAVAGVTESIIAGAAVIRNSIGALGVIAVLFIAAGPFVKAFISMAIFRITAVISSAFTSNVLADTLEAIASGYTMAIGMLAAASGGIILSAAIAILVFGG